MESEKIVTEVVNFNTNGKNESFVFPEIQKLLDSGYKVKNMFYTPLSDDSGYCAVSITVHVSK